MNQYLSYWSKETNPESGAAFEHFRKYMECTNNGTLDVDALLESEFGEKLTLLLARRFVFEQLDPMCNEVLEYYKSIGVRKRMFETDNFFTRWALFTPAELEEGRRYPLLVWNKGGKEAIEDEEYVTDIIPMTAREKYFVLMAQNTDWDNLDTLIDKAASAAPVDLERVYMGGFSQGGRNTGSYMMRRPERLAAGMMNGGPIFDITDNHSVPYTLQEVENLTAVFVPFLQVQNACDVSNCSPCNVYRPRKDTPKINNNLYQNPNYDFLLDPTYNHDGVTRERINAPKRGDKDVWMTNLINLRMGTLGCQLRDPDRCRAFAGTPEDVLHHMTGLYGDREETRKLFGVNHYIIDIDNRDGVNAFRYIVVENTNHWPPVTIGKLMWDFFRQFRRDSATGEIVVDEYKP